MVSDFVPSPVQLNDSLDFLKLTSTGWFETSALWENAGISIGW